VDLAREEEGEEGVVGGGGGGKGGGVEMVRVSDCAWRRSWWMGVA
jgi:hypothetical protein